MYDESAEPKLKRGEHKAANAAKGSPYNWKIHTVTELIQFRDEISRLLPPTSLKDMNLEEELLLQFHSLRELQTKVLDDDDQALNQRAQVANAVSNTLAKLIEMQSDVYKQERFKAIEALVIRQLTKLPESVAKSFLDEYEVLLEALK